MAAQTFILIITQALIGHILLQKPSSSSFIFFLKCLTKNIKSYQHSEDNYLLNCLMSYLSDPFVSGSFSHVHQNNKHKRDSCAICGISEPLTFWQDSIGKDWLPSSETLVLSFLSTASWGVIFMSDLFITSISAWSQEYIPNTSLLKINLYICGLGTGL